MTVDLLLRHLLSLPTVNYALLSPDGRWVAYEWYRVREHVDVYLVSADGASSPRAIAHTLQDTRLVSWSADSRSLVLSEDRDGNERARLYRVRIAPDEKGMLWVGDMQSLTLENQTYFVRGGTLSPDEKRLYYGANYDFSSKELIEPTWIYCLDLRTGQHTPLARPIKPAYIRPELNLAGNALIYARKDRHPAGRQYYLVDLVKNEDREILNLGDREKVFARWFPDSQNILVISETSGEGQPGYSRLGIYHWPSGDLRWLVDDFRRDIESAWVSPQGDLIVDEMIASSHIPTFILKPEGGWRSTQVEKLRETRFPSLKGNLRPLGRARDGAWIGLHYSSNSPTDLVRFRLGENLHRESLTNLGERTAINQCALTCAESFGWKSVDGLPIQGWLYRAEHNARRAVIYIHGGPSSHSEDKLNPEIQYLTHCGFNVLDVNYRGSTGFGLQFRELIKDSGWGGLEQEDIATSASALIAHGLAEPGRVGVTGTSYGGYCAWYLITHYPPELIAAAAPICGMTDLVVDYNTTRPDLRPYSEEMMGGSPQQVPERYYERSPINFVQNIHGKLLIVQGARDPNVTPENVSQVISRLEAHQISYDLLIFPDEGHGIYKPANQRKLFVRLTNFFEAALV